MNTKIMFTSHFLVKLLVLLVGFFLSGCEASTIKYYGYMESIKEYEWGRIEIRLDGTYKTISDDEEVYSAPYRLKIFFIGEKLKDCSVSVSEVTLQNPKGEPVLSKTEISKKITWSDIHKITRASFVFDEVDIAYEDYYLVIKGTLTDCLNQNFNESLLIKKNYHEEKVTLWNKLMGI